MIQGERTLRLLLLSIQSFLDDPLVTELSVNEPDKVWIEKAGRWSEHRRPELTYDRLDAISILAARMTSRDVDGERPLCGSTLPDGQRIQVCRPPATLAGTIALCIRKPPSSTPSLDDDDRLDLFKTTNTIGKSRNQLDGTLLRLYRAGDYRELLKVAVKARKTIGACGLTGSGKTQLLRGILQEIPAHHRLVTVESDPEFGDAGPPNKVALFYNEARQGQQAVDVVKASLRMYPATIAFQEVRGDESFALMRAILSGHNSFTSWHSAEGAEIEAMCMMLRQHPSCNTVPDAQLIALVKSCFDVIAYCARDEHGFSVPRLWCRVAEEAEQGGAA